MIAEDGWAKDIKSEAYCPTRDGNN